MKAMVLNAYGDAATFEAADLPEPVVTEGHVVVRIAATSVNTVDTMIKQMGQEQLPLSPDLPAVLGMDFAGTVEAVGEGVDGGQQARTHNKRPDEGETKGEDRQQDCPAF